MYRIEITLQAQAELKSARDWLEQREQGLGKRLLHEIKQLWPAMQRNPDQFVLVDEPGWESELRLAIVKRFHYRVVFQVVSSKKLVRIVRITHPSRDNWLP